MSQPEQEVYPTNPVMTTQPESSHSDGSFGPVFAVLAVIVVISAVACVLGRLCSRRHHRAKEAPRPPKAANKQSHGGGGGGGLGPKEWESRQKPNFNMRDGDIEFGFDMKMNPAKGGKNGGGKGNKQSSHHNGARKPDVRFADNV
ncbi:hypothetical protein CDL12_23016 [Handroanthus impetiginosus]|uniref:Transmembrane protein n=1 Tax=Handroanthus impetiginosus TaxID=429701 RepID=A0A2G9GHF7_9LAMI|nr:hypothetical protein CDL12_23016 [Handroanthus impetiginosus]